MMQFIITQSQSAFVHARQILDCSLIANECIDTRLKEGRQGVIFRIDKEKV